MGNLSHTVGGTDNLVSFKSAARVPIDSLKVHFKPIQEGEGDPSPENIRPIKGWNEVEAYRAPEVMPFKVVYKVGTSLGVSFTCNNNGIITANGIPTSYSTFMPIEVQVKGDEILYEKIFGNMQNVTITAPFLFDKDGNQIKANLSDSILGKSYGLDLSQYPGVTKVRVGIKRNSNNVPMTGSCIIAITNGAPASSTTIPVTFPVTGKNLLDITKNNRSTNSVYTFSTEAINCAKVSSSNSSYVMFEQIFPAGAYTISCDYSGDGTEGPRFVCSKPIDGGTWNDYYQGYWKNFTERSCTFTAEEPFSPGLIFTRRQDHNNEPGTFYNIQLELGSEATAYETYNPDNTIYGGYVDLAKGEVVQEWISKNALWGDIKNDNPNSTTGIDSGFIFFDKEIIYATKGANAKNSFCNVGAYLWAGTDHAIPHFYPGTRNGKTCCEVYLPSNTNDQTNIQAVLKLSEPIHYPLTPVQLKAFLSNNSFWSNTNDVTEVSYAVHDTAPIRAAKKRIMMASPRLETASSDLVTFNTDVAAPLKECKVEFKPKQNLNGYDRPWVGGAGKNLLKVSSDNRIGAMRNATETDTGLNIGNDNINGGYLVKVKPNTTYTYSYTSTYNGGCMHGRIWGFAEKPDSSTSISTGTFLINKYSWTGSATFTTDENTNWVVAGAYAYDKGLNSSLTNMQVEEGSVATSYEPYENICPIEGWNEVEISHAGKSIVPFLANPFSFSYQDYYNGSSGWSNIINSDELPTGAQLIYSAYLNCANAVVSGENCVKIWIMQSNGKYRYAEGNIIQTGNSGMSYISTNVRDTDVSFEFGLGIRKGTIASNPMVEINNAPSNFEPYNGTTIPITFPTEAGTIYGGYVDLVSSELVETWKTVDLGDFSYTVDKNLTGIDRYCHVFADYGGGVYKDAPDAISDIFRSGSMVQLNNEFATWKMGVLTPTNPKFYFYVPSGTYSSPSEFASAMSGRKISYLLAEPIHYPITTQTLKTLCGTNNIWSNADGPIEIKYWKH